MKIYQKYQTDSAAETQGLWIEMGDNALIKIARLGHPKHEEVMKRLRQPHVASLRAGIDLPTNVSMALTIEALAEAILIDWKGIQDDDGKEIPYSKEAAIKLLTDLPDFRDKVVFLSSQHETFRKSALENAAKNSEPVLDGDSSGAKASSI